MAHECRPTEPAASRWLNALVGALGRHMTSSRSGVPLASSTNTTTSSGLTTTSDGTILSNIILQRWPPPCASRRAEGVPSRNGHVGSRVLDELLCDLHGIRLRNHSVPQHSRSATAAEAPSPGETEVRRIAPNRRKQKGRRLLAEARWFGMRLPLEFSLHLGDRCTSLPQQIRDVHRLISLQPL